MRVVICVDTETLYYFSPGPWQNQVDRYKWSINKLLWNFRYAQGYQGISLINKLFVKNNLPITLFAVEGVRYIIEKWDWHDKADIGSHGYSHKCLITMTDAELDKEFKAITPAISFAAPMNKIEDLDNPDRVYKHLVEKGFKIIRHQGPDSTRLKKQFHYDGVSYPKQTYPGLLKIRGTKYFEGTSSNKHIQEIIDALNFYKNVPDTFIFCLSTHDFTWKDTNIHKFYKVLDYITDNFELVNLKQLVDEFER